MAKLFYRTSGLNTQSRFLRRLGSMGLLLSKWKLRLGVSRSWS
ncbi:hypothetical protein ACHAXN_004240 [Cyclotella atomus]